MKIVPTYIALTILLIFLRWGPGFISMFQATRAYQLQWLGHGQNMDENFELKGVFIEGERHNSDWG